ncbi:uncharacterized protein BJ212DRAFT_1299972 [Suillus subaureus]|uniref:Uncharacterized protein n=1 Tax=Suillus subaureus TaxID=48587 RepID=A0A9P7EAW5_9AGAM|nr:uncharacterized protein BJ212DRAFT_1299972 [Suillus subaureus]KAG1816155.1 hypothetical protein BJ212DRAFT_1299972 [Suillus subaureus]
MDLAMARRLTTPGQTYRRKQKDVRGLHVATHRQSAHGPVLRRTASVTMVDIRTKHVSKLLAYYYIYISFVRAGTPILRYRFSRMWQRHLDSLCLLPKRVVNRGMSDAIFVVVMTQAASLGFAKWPSGTFSVSLGMITGCMWSQRRRSPSDYVGRSGQPSPVKEYSTDRMMAAMLDSQLKTLESPENEEGVATVSIDQTRQEWSWANIINSNICAAKSTV